MRARLKHGERQTFTVAIFRADTVLHEDTTLRHQPRDGLTALHPSEGDRLGNPPLIDEVFALRHQRPVTNEDQTRLRDLIIDRGKGLQGIHRCLLRHEAADRKKEAAPRTVSPTDPLGPRHRRAHAPASLWRT